MKRQLKILLIVAAAAATLGSNVSYAGGCGGRGGGIGGGYGGFAGGMRSTMRNTMSAYGGSSFGRTTMNAAPTRTFAPQQSYRNTTTYTQPYNTSPFHAPTHTYAPAKNYVPQSQPVPSYSQPATATRTVYQNTVPSQPTVSASVQQAPQGQQNAQVRQTQPVNGSNVRTAQVNTQPATQPARATQPTTTSPTTSATLTAAKDTSAEASALQMLQSIAAQPKTSTAKPKMNEVAIPQFTTAASTASSVNMAYVGTWKVDLANNQSVTLQLTAEGKFTWTAVSQGSQKSFSGQYRMTNGRLTLVRANDLQQMVGKWTGAGDAFTFKLDGSNNGGLKFKRI